MLFKLHQLENHLLRSIAMNISLQKKPHTSHSKNLECLNSKLTNHTKQHQILRHHPGNEFLVVIHHSTTDHSPNIYIAEHPADHLHR